MQLKQRIEELISANKSEFSADDRALFEEFKAALRRGAIRAAEKDESGTWQTNAWVKQGILLGFKMGAMIEMSQETETFQFFDKETYPLRPMTLVDKIRIVPGGSTIRDGSFVAPGVVCMPPCYVNVGAYVDEGTMIDSHALIGSCAQIGKRVHISAAAQIGGVLEPINANPVVIEDDCLVGGNTGVYEGVIVREKSVLASGVILTGSTPVFDLVRGEI
ncbi:MAG TPA: 2,3,4,5-tetrahydropyridine-2,6-dicarboxylate N-succinyltransferase, partial [Pyrinomonadaceae bacterium]|nr:2,3,4,5-tetrahydropyridine-2,6-dicarboxylate N-succinyltransferase [Pyrinomonadaceae bacterium]